ncbi:ESCRT-II complex subunit-domain-containing protein [Xylaria acuta]|nr:ESCRT-II complex subunit-domain-containing protein [Xylaria acuta]
MATPAPSLPTTSSSSLGAVGQLTPTTTTTTTTTPSTPLPSSSSTATATTTTTTSTTTTGFSFPREWSFPPFFTRQSNANTRFSQDSKWASLILSYCAHHRIYKLGLTSPAAEALFHNRRLDKRLSLADAREVLSFMRRDGRVEFMGNDSSSSSSSNNNNSNNYSNSNRTNDDGGGGSGGGSGGGGGGGGGGDVVWVYWRTPEEWAALVETWVDDTAQKGTVLTLYELSQGEDTIGTEFHGLDPELLQKALQVLVKRNKAQIFGQEDQLGVKFF